MYKLKKKLVSWLLLSIMTLGFVGQSIPLVSAANTELKEATITKFSIEHGDDTTGSTFNYWEKFKLNLDWDVSMYENNVHTGDYFTVQLPDTMKFPQNSSAKTFDVLDNQKNVVAKGQVSSLTEGGGNVKVVFTNYVENKYNIKGTMALAAEFHNSKVKHGALNKFDISLNGKVISDSVNVSQIGVDPAEFFYKWSTRLDNPNEAAWTLRLNYSKGKEYSNLQISDELFAQNGSLKGIHYVDGSFLLRKVKISPIGNIETVYQTTDISKDIVFNADKTSFTYKFGTLDAKSQYVIDYKTTYVSGVQLRNKATFKSDTVVTETFAHYEDASSSGTGKGDVLGTLKLVKVDAQNTQKRLANAVFKVTELADNKSFTLTTDANGEAVLDKLVPGQYKIEETTAPAGYKLDGTPRIIKVTSGVVTTEQFTNTLPVGKIEVQKQDKATKEILAGAEFDVKDSSGTVIEHIITGAKGLALTKDLAVGNYTLVETKAPTGYVLNATPQTVVVKENEKTTVTFVNEKIKVEKGIIKIKKTESKCGFPLSGAEFAVLDNSGKVVATAVTGFFGEATVSLPVGTYQVKETKAPKGYILDETPKEVVVSANQTTTVKFVNVKLEKGKIVIKKYDERCGYALQGAEFIVVDAKGKTVATLNTNYFGEATIELPVGNYQVKETKAPKGYVLDETVKSVNVVKNTMTIVKVSNKRIQIESGKLKIKKYDARFGQLLQGAEFIVIDATGKTVATGTTNQCGEITFELPVGNYQVKETKAPKGYELQSKPVSVIVVKGKTTTVSVYNRKANDCIKYVWNNCYIYYYCNCKTDKPSGGEDIYIG